MCLARAGASEGGVDGENKGGRTGRGGADVKISNKWREGGKKGCGKLIRNTRAQLKLSG